MNGISPSASYKLHATRVDLPTPQADAATSTPFTSIRKPHTSTVDKNGKGDSVSISDAARQLAEAATREAESTGATMTALSDRGARITVEATTTERTTFSMGGQLARQSAFSLAQAPAETAALEVAFSVTFDHANGTRQVFDITGNAVFRETDDGTIIKDSTQGEGSKTLQGSDDNQIFVAIEDGTEVVTGNGNNRVFNMARNSRITGGEGHDLIASLADGAHIEAGAGDDAVILLRDTLRPVAPSSLDEGSADAPENRTATHRTPGAQTVTVDAGDGDNQLTAGVDLYKGSIRTGNGTDTVTLRDATSLQMHLGAGDDNLQGQNLFHSLIDTGAGDDNITLNALRGGGLSAGDGNDTLRASLVFDAFIDGGRGDDVINLTKAESSVISGGAGNDAITVDTLINSRIDGGAGDDTINVGNAINSLITGGTGRNTIIANALTDDPTRSDALENAMAARIAQSDTTKPDTRDILAVGPGGSRRSVSGA